MRRLLALAVLAASPAVAQTLPTKPVLTLEAANRVIAAAAAEAGRAGAPAVLAVVDDGGYMIALQRMDGAPMLASVELAPEKARAAALYRKPTQALEQAINQGRSAAVTAPFTQMQGGMPITVGKDVVGAIGVSADTPAHDQQIAEAGAKAVGN